MSHVRRLLGVAALVTAAATCAGFAPPAGGATAASGTTPALPQVAAAQRAAAWLAGQFDTQGFIPTTPGGSTPDLSATAQAALGLAEAQAELSVAHRALSYLEENAAAAVTAGGADGPGQLGVLILDAQALGADPRSFGGIDLVTSLLDTQQTSGSDAGLFGSEAQLATYLAGTYDQGLALAALAAAGVRGTDAVEAAASWLDSQQCADGGWTLPDQALNPCDGVPGTFPATGPDTNSTTLAVEGLAAQGSLTQAASAGALGFFTAGEGADAGWSYYPNSAAHPQTSQPTSTALVVQALLALGSSPSASSVSKGSANPVSRLLSFQLATGPDAGAFFEPPSSTAGDLIATYESIPALEGVTLPPAPPGPGYWEVAADGTVSPFGAAATFGSMGGRHLNAPIVGMAATTTGNGYWEVASDGGVFAFGDATFEGSMGGRHLNAPIVGMAATTTGNGYWEVASDGGVFAFGDATFEGSMGGRHLNAPIVGIASTPGGKGYWEVASDGGVFAFGDAAFEGSMGGKPLGAPVVGIASTPDGKGYWEVASDGGVFAFGDAAFEGSMGGKSLGAPVVGIASTPDGKGYWEVASDGSVYAFGDAGYSGSLGSQARGVAVEGISANAP